MTDIGVSCQKDSYGRGAGSPLGCADGLEMSGALCYPACRNEFNGNGPVCWQRCPGGRHDCGALCTPSADVCTDTVKGIAENVVSLAVAAATVAAGGSVDIPSII